MKTIELLAPAGSPEALDAAIGEGADAVYLGLKDFNARLRSANFAYSQFEGALRALRRMGKKIYVTVNTVFEQREADRMYQLLKYLEYQQPDALIVQDFGVVAMARAEFPSLRLHASTQMNIASARGANALSRHGISRVVLARELSLEELRSVRAETNLELEVFVHGALCVSASGVCLFSSFLGGKSANRGMCTQACRRLYRRAGSRAANLDSSEGESGYYFSPNDLQLLERVPDLFAAGINALKIEGRMKSASYVGAVVSAYRLVADAVMRGDEEEIRRSVETGREILRNDFARPKTQFLFGKGENGGIDWLNPRQDGGTGISLGTILKVKGTGGEKRALVSPPRGLTLSAGDSVRIHSSDDSGRITHKLAFVQHKNDECWISAPDGSSDGASGGALNSEKQGQAAIGDSVYLIQTKAMSKRYAPIASPVTGAHGSRGPGREKAPFPQIEIQKRGIQRNSPRNGTGGKRAGGAGFPEGLYVAVSRPEDLYIVQSSRPQMVMLAYSRKNAKYLLSENKPPLPFKPAGIILTLDPYFPQGTGDNHTDKIAEEIGQLIDMGYEQYMLNNPGHFSLFRGYDNVKLIAGPWLYMFNSWSLSFIASVFSAGKYRADGFVSPLENNRQNLERTLGFKKRPENAQGKKPGKRQISAALHSKFFIPVFAWPPLFNIRADLGPVLGNALFADNNGDLFSLVCDREGSRVYPEKPFSIIDKIPFLKQAGFNRFIVDLSSASLKKSDYRDLMRAVNENSGSIRPLPQTSRFNWKDGFYKKENA